MVSLVNMGLALPFHSKQSFFGTEIVWYSLSVSYESLKEAEILSFFPSPVTTHVILEHDDRVLGNRTVGFQACVSAWLQTSAL